MSENFQLYAMYNIIYMMSDDLAQCRDHKQQHSFFACAECGDTHP